MLNVSAERIYTSFVKFCSSYLKDSLITPQGKKREGREGKEKKLVEKERE